MNGTEFTPDERTKTRTNEGMYRTEFTPDERTKTRTNHLDEMKSISVDAVLNKFANQSRPRVLFVDGIAGCGKSLICMAHMLDRARRYPNEGILHLCDNEYLASTVRRKLGQVSNEMANGIQVFSVSDWLIKLVCHNYMKIAADDGRNQEICIPSIKKKDALEKFPPDKYQHVFVEQYQDMKPSVRGLLQGLFIKKRTFYVFYDSLQNTGSSKDVSQRSQSVAVPPEAEHIVLNTVYRYPRLIAQYVKNNCPGKDAKRIISMGHEFDGQPVDVRCAPSSKTKQQFLCETVEDLKKTHGLEDRNITVLQESLEENIIPSKFAVKCQRETVDNFRGLEKKVIISYFLPILTEEGKIDHQRQQYIAASSATWMYVVLVEKKEVEDHLNRVICGDDYVLVDPGRFTKTKQKQVVIDPAPLGTSNPTTILVNREDLLNLIRA